MNFCTFRLFYGSLFKDTYNDDYLYKLADIFEDKGWTESVKNELLDPDSKGITGNKIDVTIHDKNIIIEPLFEETPEEFAITIDRQVLLQLIDTWQELVSKNAQEITFIRYDDGLITMSGKFEAEK